MDIILYNINPMHFRKQWNYSGGPGRSLTIAFTPTGSAGIQEKHSIDDKFNIKNPYTINAVSIPEKYSGAPDDSFSLMVPSKPHGTFECCN
jgi:hypothetical protein